MMKYETASDSYSSWYGKPYYSLDAYCKNTYGEKLYKLALSSGLTCPNRDGTLDNRGCIFCSKGGSGDYALPIEPDIHQSIVKSKALLSGKKTGQKFIAYFQAFTNTYGPIAYLEKIYTAALEDSDVKGISIATRPDCLETEVIALLKKLKSNYPHKFIWIELGLQTIHEHTASWIRRGYSLEVFNQAVRILDEIGIFVVVHVILGLPGETPKDMLDTIDYLNFCPIWGIKLSLLYIIKDTDLGELFLKTPDLCGSFSSMAEYLDILVKCITHLRPNLVIHRVTGDAPKNLLLYPAWSLDKRNVLNSLHKQMKVQNLYQGKEFIHA